MFEPLKLLSKLQPKGELSERRTLPSDDDSSDDDDFILPTKKQSPDDKMQQIIKKRKKVLLDEDDEDSEEDLSLPMTKKRMTMNDVKITPPKEKLDAENVKFSLSCDEEQDDVIDEYVPLSADKVEWEEMFADGVEEKNDAAKSFDSRCDLTQAPKKSETNGDEKIATKTRATSSSPVNSSRSKDGSDHHIIEKRCMLSAVSDESEASVTEHQLENKKHPTKEAAPTNQSEISEPEKQKAENENEANSRKRMDLLGQKSGEQMGEVASKGKTKSTRNADSELSEVNASSTSLGKAVGPVKKPKVISKKQKAPATKRDLKESGTKAASDKAVSTNESIPAVTPKKRRRGVRQKAIVLAKEESIQVSQERATLSEKLWKEKHEAQKRLLREIKTKEQELDNLRKDHENLKMAVDAALLEKRQSAKDHKKLAKLWEKVESELANEVAKAAAKAAVASKAEFEKELKKKRIDQATAITPSAKKSTKRKQQKEYDESSESDEDDSDWEGAKRSPSIANKTSSENKRGKRCRRQDWSCSVCTYDNPLTETKCSMCETPRPGTIPEDFDEE